MTAGSAGAEDIRAHIEAIRKKLLDLSLRNRMLNYRPSKRLGIAVTGEDSFQVHRILVEESKQMSFIGKPDPPRKRNTNAEIPDFSDDVAMEELRKSAEEELAAFLDNAAMPVNQMDTKLSTEEYESVLQAKLRAIMREASLANEELGINTLFLTLGTLEWCETDAKSYKAPLVFVPVVLKQQANGSIRIFHDGSDIGTNLPLRAKINESNMKLPELDEEKSLLDYFAEVESTIRSRKDWTVHRDDICLGFFNYEKYAMYVDLGGESWPENRKPWMDKDLISMLSESYPNVSSSIREDSFLDDVRTVEDGHEVYNADSSQTVAMIRAASGLSMVIEGPPGTGKSQTITNIIAEAVASGKTVLFVSAKRAALDVVKRKLVEAELGDMCLDLHDKLTNRREFYAEIKRTVGMHLHLSKQEERVVRLTELRNRLNSHSKAVNEPLTAYGVAPFTAMSILARLPKETPDDREARIPFELLKHWTHAEVAALKAPLQALQARMATAGVPEKHAFWGAQISYVDPSIRLDLDEALEKAKSSIETALKDAQHAAETFRISPPATANDVAMLRVCAERALTAPPLDGVAVKAESWRSEEDSVRELIGLLRERAGLRSSREAHLLPEAWSVDPSGMLASYDRHADKWYRVVIGEFRAARRELRRLTTVSAPADPQGQRSLLKDLQRLRTIESGVLQKEGLAGRLFGVQWQRLETNPDLLETLLEWVLKLHADIDSGRLPAGLIDFFSGAHADQSLLRSVENAEKSAESAIDHYRKLAGILQYPSESCPSEEWPVLAARVDCWHQALPRLGEYISLMDARKLALDRGLSPVVEVADRWVLASDRLIDTFLRSYYTGVVREAMEHRPELRTFERVAHEQAIAEFKTLDEFKLRYNRARVRLKHHQGLPRFDNAAGNLHLLKVQCELQRRHKPIRWIMARAGEAIQRIKPVFMMSPLSVAIHLPPEMPPFDLVIFDEASQVKPEDALCAIIRSNQTIVVGDTRQMPPTSFFDRVADGDDEDDDDTTETAREAAKLESVLALMSVGVDSDVRRPDLKWHYRSLHPSLIQPSNEMFYENRLVIFPSPGVESEGRRIGVVFHHYPQTVYEAGDRKRFNRKEAEIVAEAVLRHITHHPDQSLMIAAMNKPQADLIFAEVQKLERLHQEAFHEFNSRHPHERLDVKNLENVQGDERDVVFISMTYGRDENGILRYQFGPILRDGGERRLNVLITRARLRCEVFSNFTADDLRVEPGKRGLEVLKRYLSFAQTGRIEVPIATGREEESPFEEEVSAALRELGYQVDTQVGTEGCRIDLAVIDPANPGRYLIGVECDGASYHSSRSARDRDKLRQSVLESRGWVLHRIWSTDWWQDRDSEIVRLREAIERAKQEGPRVDRAVIEHPDEPLVEQRDDTLQTTPIVRPYFVTPPSADIVGEEGLRRFVLRVVTYEGPIVEELLLMRLRDAAGYSQARGSTRAWLQGLIMDVEKSGQIRKVDNAYVYDDLQLVRARDWSARPASERKIDFVPDTEIKAVIKTIVEGAFGIGEEDIVGRVFGLLGFRRTSEEAKMRTKKLIAGMVKDGMLSLESESYVVRA